MKKVTIIGGGICGLCSAYYLIKEGYEITIIDKNNLDSGTSFINAGYIIPSHFISMAAPGMISKGLRWMFDSSSPFYIKPRIDPEFFRWAVKFHKSATQRKVESAIPILKEINIKSKELYEEMLSSFDFPFHYENKGLLMAYSTEKGKEEELKVAERAVEEGLSVKQLSKEDLKQLQPEFSDKVEGAIHYECDSHTTPNRFMTNLKNWLKEKGVIFELNQEVVKVVSDSRRIIAVQTKDKHFEADEFVLAAGSWTPIIAKMAGLKIPIQGGKGYSMDIYRPNGITLPAILVEAKVAVTPMDGFTRFAGTMEFSGNNSIIRKNRIEAIAKSANYFYNNIVLEEREKDAAVSGLRPVSPDGLPFIGRTSILDNLIISSGHSMMGWSLGPLTGKLVTELVLKKTTSVDLHPFRVDRFN